MANSINVYKMIFLHVNRACIIVPWSCSRRLEEVFIFVFRRHPKDVLIKINIFVLVIKLQYVLKTSCKSDFKTSSRHFQDVSTSQTVHVNNSSRHLGDVFNTFLRRTAKMVIYRKNCLSHASEKFMVRV